VIDPIILARGVHFAATVLAVGTVTFRTLVADPAPIRRRLSTLTWSALALAVITGAIWLLLLAADLTGDSIVDAALNGGAWTVLSATRFGLMTGARLALAAVLAASIVWPRARWLALAAAAAFIALLAWIGHSGATPGAAGDTQLTSDVVHLLAAGAWLGGLPALVLLLAQARGDPRERASAAAATRRFGTLGLICVAALVASGLFNAWNLLAAPRDLLTTDYGRMLSAKLVLVAGMLAFATVNRFALTPRAADPGARRLLKRNSAAEAFLGLGVLFLVGALGTLPPTAHRHEPVAEIPPDAAFVHIHDVTAMADVTVTPGRTGVARASIRLSREDGTEFAAEDVRLALDPPKVTANRIDLPAVRQPDGAWIVPRLEIGQPGNWTVRVLVTPANGPPLVLDAPIVIEP